MSDEFKHLRGRYKQPFTPSINNPEVVKKTDWWDDMCKAHGAKNHWKKKDYKTKPKSNNPKSNNSKSK